MFNSDYGYGCDCRQYAGSVFKFLVVAGLMTAFLASGWVVIPDDVEAWTAGEYLPALAGIVLVGGGAFVGLVATTIKRLRDARFPENIFYALLLAFVLLAIIEILPGRLSFRIEVLVHGLLLFSGSLLVYLMGSLMLVEDYALTESKSFRQDQKNLSSRVGRLLPAERSTYESRIPQSRLARATRINSPENIG